MRFGLSKAEGNAVTNHEIKEGKPKMKKIMKTASMVAALAMVLAGVAFSAETIKVGHLADLTGPTGDVGKPYAEGVQDYKEYINSHGGINGKKIGCPATSRSTRVAASCSSHTRAPARSRSGASTPRAACRRRAARR